MDGYEGEDDDDADMGFLVRFLSSPVFWAHIVAIVLLRCVCGCCCRRAETTGDDALRPEHLQPRKRVASGYLLWLFGGLLGAHHFYLERLVHGVLVLWTLNFGGFGWLLDGLCLPAYVGAYNARRTSLTAPYDGSRRKLFCHLPGALLGVLLFLALTIAFLPSVFHTVGIVDLDMRGAQTEANPYKILGVPNGSPMHEVKAAYRKESLQWHPDRNHGCGKRCEAKMSEITKAFEYLKKNKGALTEDRTWQDYAKDLGKRWWAVLEIVITAWDKDSGKAGSGDRTEL